MKVFLVHHANTVAAADNPARPLSDLGRAQADRIGAHLKTAGIAPRRILHSDKLWTQQTAERIGYKPGHGALFCLEGAGTDWVVAYALRQEHMGG